MGRNWGEQADYRGSLPDGKKPGWVATVSRWAFGALTAFGLYHVATTINEKPPEGKNSAPENIPSEAENDAAKASSVQSQEIALPNHTKNFEPSNGYAQDALSPRGSTKLDR